MSILGIMMVFWGMQGVFQTSPGSAYNTITISLLHNLNDSHIYIRRVRLVCPRIWTDLSEEPRIFGGSTKLECIVGIGVIIVNDVTTIRGKR